jgi:hypothetical protein
VVHPAQKTPTLKPCAAAAQLVENPNDAGVFLPRLLPGLEKVSQEVPDPECRSVAAKARDTLLKIVPDPSAIAPPEAHDFKVCFAHATAALHSMVMLQSSSMLERGDVAVFEHAYGEGY